MFFLIIYLVDQMKKGSSGKEIFSLIAMKESRSFLFYANFQERVFTLSDGYLTWADVSLGITRNSLFLTNLVTATPSFSQARNLPMLAITNRRAVYGGTLNIYFTNETERSLFRFFFDEHVEYGNEVWEEQERSRREKEAERDKERVREEERERAKEREEARRGSF